jgi:hypothetical protein
MQADIGQVKTALGLLYNVKETTSSQRKEANRWLEQFQKTVRIWLIFSRRHGLLLISL